MDKRRQKVLGITNSVSFAPDAVSQLPDISNSMIGQTVKLKISPKVVNRIELGRIRRKPLQDESLMRLDKLFHLFTTMDTGTIPQDNNPSSEMVSQLPEKTNSFSLGDILVGMKSQIKPQSLSLRRNTNCTNSRDFLVTLGSVAVERSLASGRPGPTHCRQHKKTRFVNKDKGCTLPPGFFLYGANLFLPNVESPFRFVPEHDPLVFDNSSSLHPKADRYSGYGRKCRISAGLPGQSGDRSINRWNSPAPALLSRVLLLTPPSVSLRALRVCRDVVEQKSPLSPALGTLDSNAAQSADLRLPSRLLGKDDTLSGETRWRVAAVSLILWLFRLVSYNIYRQFPNRTLAM